MNAKAPRRQGWKKRKSREISWRFFSWRLGALAFIKKQMSEAAEILKQVEALGVEARGSLARISDPAGIAAWHHEYLSKKGKIPTLLKSVGSIKEIEAKKQA